MHFLEPLKYDIKWLPQYRELLKNLVTKNLRIKYRSSVLGYLWSLLNPALLIFVYYIAFNYVLTFRQASSVAELVTGIVFWQFAASTINSSCNSIIGARGLIEKVRFPRIIPIISGQAFNCIQYLLTFPAVFVLLYVFYYKVTVFSVHLLWLPLFLILLNVFLFGISLFLATAVIFYRDIKHFIDIALKLLFWLTPIIYDIEKLNQSASATMVVKAMPFTPFIRCLQRIMVHGEMPPLISSLQCGLYTFVALIVGIIVFYSYQHRFVEEF